MLAIGFYFVLVNRFGLVKLSGVDLSIRNQRK